jgi:predicted nucleic acid-binding protein
MGETALATKRVYLDVCALCRPFDEQTQMRIRLETDAIQLILSHIRSGRLTLIVSPAHEVEIMAIEDLAEQEHLISTLQQISRCFTFNLEQTRIRAEQLVQLGLGPADAAHLAFAEAAQANFVTCDDRLLRRCRRVRPGIWVGGPVAFCEKERLR